MRRNHELKRLKPEGLWRSPLTDEQVELAIGFGTKIAAQNELAIHDVFLVEVNSELEAVISFSTAFERLAVYASQQASRSERVDPVFVEGVRSLPIFRTHYALDIISPHKTLNVVRFFPGKSEQMTLVERTQLDRRRYRQVVAFPYRDVNYSTEGASVSSLTGSSVLFEVSEQFEVSARTMFSKKQSDVLVDLRNYH